MSAPPLFPVGLSPSRRFPRIARHVKKLTEDISSGLPTLVPPEVDGGSAPRFPWQEPALDFVKTPGEGEAEQRDNDQADIHRIDRHKLPSVPDHVADPALRADHLGDRDQD